MIHKAYKIIKNLLWEFRFLIPTLLISVIIFSLIIQISYVPTNSMAKIAGKGSLVITTRYDKRNVKRGDIITFKRNNILLIKRVIGIEGDTIEIKSGVVKINGQRETNPNVKGKARKDGTYKVPKGKYFVMGDNRKESIASESWKEPYISKEEITGISKYSITNHRIHRLKGR